MRPFLTAVLGAALLFVASCSKDSSQCELNPEVARVQAPVQLERLEKPFFEIRTAADAQRFVQQHPLFANQFLQRKQFPSDEALAQYLVHLSTNKELQKLGRESAAAFPDATLEPGLQRMFQHVRYYFPAFRVPPVKTFVSGFSHDLFVNDSLMVLSLDFFAGPKASYRPNNMPNYILRRYAPPYLLPTAALAVSSKYNQREGTNPSMLGEMVQFGKSLYFAEKVLPCTADTLLVGFTGAEMAGVQFNESKIWAHFIEKNLLYSTAPFTIQKYMGERPNVPEIGQNCPGRVGAWVGWQIVRKYMSQHPNVTLAQLMAEKDPQRILSQSRYRPVRK
ncbi:gliding motility lipoprotein GldB [Hymenobacter persicinus]|uniref:Gliding motility lipoprotein GldB n=1 Tax=Hymenobacter persicinus TaxID=2025506 RepID=A0A4Q5LFI0_9BACT|nr:gliding motility lipoprotein GldB [Hymenobacter persicinus]RYU83788.1 gliding motility lipoprotein GldB [Hymenobacter persicinus]